MKDLILQIEVAYTSLYQAYLSNDRNRMTDAYIKAGKLGIPYFQESVMIETKRAFITNGMVYGPPTDIQQIWDMPSLQMNVIGCLNALQTELNQRKAYQSHGYAQQMLYGRPHHVFCGYETLYTKQNQELKVADLLKVLRYSISVAQAIEPDNENYEYASAALTVLQGIDATLNNKPEDKPVSKMLHLATSFLSSIVKSSLTNAQDKRNVTITSIMLDLAIDFFCDK